MPLTALKNLAKKAKISDEQAEHYWHVAKSIVKKEYDVDEKDGKFWALTTGIAKKLMGLKEGLTFKEFLDEASVGDEPNIEQLKVDKAVEMLNANCKDALWMLYENRPIYRGDYRLLKNAKVTGFAVVDASATERRSENTSNYYTLIFDNIPKMKEFPKRSRSFIATTTKDTAVTYAIGQDGAVSVLIPFDGVKIGFVNKRDMWDVQLTPFDLPKDSVTSQNEIFQSMGLPDNNWDAWIKFDKELKNDDKSAYNRFSSAVGYKLAEKYKRSFLEVVGQAYSPANTKFTHYTTANMPHSSESEVWIGGKCVIISQKMWSKLLKKVNAK